MGRPFAARLFEVLDESDNESALGEEDFGCPFDHGYRLIGEPDLEINFRDEGGGVEFFQGLSDAFSLRAREASLLSSSLTMPLVSIV